MRNSRQSMYPGPSSPAYWSALDSCSQSLHSTCSSLNGAIVNLHQGTYDFPRLSAIISSRRCFEVVTESEVRSAQRDLAEEISPQIQELIGRAELGLEGLKKKEKLLRTKVDKRTQTFSSSIEHHSQHNHHLSSHSNSSRPPPDLVSLRRQLEQLQDRKESLGKAVEKLDSDAIKYKRMVSTA